MVDSSATGESLSVGSVGQIRSGLPGHSSARPSVPSFPPSSSSFIRQSNSRHTPPVSFHPPRGTLPVLLSFKSNRILDAGLTNDRRTDFTGWNFGWFVPTLPLFLLYFFFFIACPLLCWSILIFRLISLIFFPRFLELRYTTRRGKRGISLFFFFLSFWSIQFFTQKQRIIPEIIPRREIEFHVTRGRSSRGKLVVENSRRKAPAWSVVAPSTRIIEHF